MGTVVATTTKALRIKAHPDDNVAIIGNSGGLPRGTMFEDGLTLVDYVPQGHKVALEDIPEGGGVRRYGERIGFAARPLLRGSWIDEFSVRLPDPPALDSLPLATRVPKPLPPLDGYTFDGYRNPDGSVGTRNILGISTRVQCVAGVVAHVGGLAKERVFRRIRVLA